MSWPRAAQPTELAAWRRRREQDVAIRAFRRGRYSDTEFRAAAASAQLPPDALEDEVLRAPPQEPGSPWPDSPPLGRSGSAAVHLRGPRFSEHREQLGLD